MRRLTVLVLAGLLAAPPGFGAPATAPSAEQIAFHALRQDIGVAQILQGLRAGAAHGIVVIRNVRVVDPVDARVTPGQTVIVYNSTIYWVGDAAEEPKLHHPITVAIDGAGRYMSPGLVDMHVHSNSAAGWLLELANGITAVRDMDGFPWLLKVRESVNTRRMLAPVDYVAGTIINADTLDGYGVWPRDALDARRIVRQQAACGYDFIKVHNIVPEPMFDAIADEAAKMGMDLVGHVPHGVAVRHAAQKGMRTMEHLKGFLDDRTLLLGDTDYAAVVDGPDVWNTPTLVTWWQATSPAELRDFLDAPAIRYVPLRRRAAWQALAAQPQDDSFRLDRDAARISRDIMAKLVSVHAKFLAGTDAGNMDFLILGYSLVEELQLLQSAGLAPADVMRAATSEPAKAMRLESSFGRIAEGMRADFVLLASNPLESAAAYKSNSGVMAHGQWLGRSKIDAALGALAAIYAEPDTDAKIVRPDALAVYAKARALGDDGFVFDDKELAAAAAALRKSGWIDIADEFTALADVPTNGPCAETLR